MGKESRNRAHYQEEIFKIFATHVEELLSKNRGVGVIDVVARLWTLATSTIKSMQMYV